MRFRLGLAPHWGLRAYRRISRTAGLRVQSRALVRGGARAVSLLITCRDGLATAASLRSTALCYRPWARRWNASLRRCICRRADGRNLTEEAAAVLLEQDATAEHGLEPVEEQVGPPVNRGVKT